MLRVVNINTTDSQWTQMIWDGNLIHTHTTLLFSYSKTTISHQLTFPQTSPYLWKPKEKLHFLMRWTVWLVFDKIKNAHEWSSAACHLFSHLTKPLFQVFWEVCPRKKSITELSEALNWFSNEKMAPWQLCWRSAVVCLHRTLRCRAVTYFNTRYKCDQKDR